ncbi:MAG: SGNH/GDSL hydrolase family protein [Armatimonadetes bacterium]|nr:SGNH/GDSL hydrolase family protein [Armatimonadota bacterium]
MVSIHIAPDHPGPVYERCVRLAVTPSEASFDRFPVDSPYACDSPGASVRFLSDAAEVTVHISYPAKGSLPGHGSFNSTGVCLIDDRIEATFTRVCDGQHRQAVALKPGASGRAREFEMFLPVADPVRFNGLALHGGSGLAPCKKLPGPLYMAYGDSITQGFWASSAMTSYPSRTARAMGWQAINMGFGGRRAAASDGAALTARRPDVASILIGVNDCLGQVPLADFAANVAGILDALRDAHPALPVYLLTPLPVPGNWQGIERLEEYRQALRDLAAGRHDRHLYPVEGSALISEDPALYADGLHPNDLGFEQLARNLCALMAQNGLTFRRTSEDPAPPPF